MTAISLLLTVTVSVMADPTDPTGLGRGQEWHGGMFDSRLMALDYRTGDVKWQHKYP